MKKLFLFLCLMTISLGQSQTLVGTWKVTSIGVGGGRGQTNYFSVSSSSGARACFFDDEYVFDADGDFHNVQQGSTFVEDWQGGSNACGTPVAPHDGSNAATYSSTATTLTLTGVGAHLGLAKVITDSEISSPDAAPASVTYLLTSLTSTTLTVDVALTNGAWWRFVLSNEVVAPPTPVVVPTVAASTPTQAAADVISIFSGAYTNVGVSTLRTSWSDAADLETVTIDGNTTLKYNALNYAGIDINPANQINATSMETFHIDMWTPDGTTFKVKIVDFGADGVYGGGDDKAHEVTRTPTKNGWNSFDLPLSEFIGLTTRANINQIVLVSSGGTVYVDNMYFWKTPAGTYAYYADADGDGYGSGAVFLLTATTAPEGYSSYNTDCKDNDEAIYPGATEIADGLDNDCDGTIDEGFPPSTAAPTPPTRNAWDVVSIFSGAYNNVTLSEVPTSWSETAIAPFSVESIAGNDTWKFGGEFLGMVTNYDSGVNLAQMDTMHVDYWTADPNLLVVKIVNTVDGGAATTIVEDPTQTGSWRSRDISMSAFGGSINKSKITQLLIDPQSGGSTVYVDNFYFYREATGAPSPTIGALTVPAKVIGDADFQLTAPTSNGSGAFTFTSSNTAVATISGSTVHIVDAGSSIITATQAADGVYSTGIVIANLEVSLATAAPTPTIPADRVLSVYSDAAGYASIADTSLYPNWGQATQYAQVNVVGNPTLKYSNLNYQGIQLGSVVDLTSYQNVHLNIYGAGTSSVNFSVINQEGGAGSTDVKREANTAITLNPGWNSVVIPVASLKSINPDFELNRVGQLSFAGSGTIYVDNIYFSKATPSHTTPPTVANISYCKGDKAVALTASTTNVLKWYTVATAGTASATAPTPLTTTVGTKSYYVAQVMSDGFISPRAVIVVTVNAVLAAPATITGTAAQGPLVGTETTATYSIVAVAGAASYLWTVPTGVNIKSGQGTTQITVDFKNVPTGAGAIGNIGVTAVTAAGCASPAKTLALTKALLVAPTAIKMTDASLPIPASGIATAVTSFAKYVETDKVLTVTAAQVVGATSYDWELPAGVTKLTGGNTNVITIDFKNVTRADYYTYDTTAATPVQTNVLRIGVKARNGVGVSTTANTTAANPATGSTAKLLTLTAVAPAAVSAIVMTNDAVSTTAAVTSVSTFVNSGTVLTLTAAPSALASSYHWILPNGVNRISPDESANTNVIQVMFNGDTFGATTFYIGVRARNGVGASSTRNVAPAPLDQWKYLKLTAAIPAAPGATTGTLAICKTKESSVTYTITAAAKDAVYYNVTAPAGCTLNTSYDNSIRVLATANATFTVNYPTGFTANTTTSIKTITIQSVNGVGVNTTATNKVLKLTNTNAVCPVDPFRIAATKAIATVNATEAYPNPVSNDFKIDVTAAKAGVLEIAIYSLDNNLVVSPKTLKLQAGANTINENVSSLNKGIYFVRLVNSSTGEVITKKLIKN